MKQITEDYCSFEIAKLLKEKGFKNEYCDNMLLAEDGDTIWKFATFTNRDDAFDATMKFKKQIPYVTHQMALKWLREVHNIFIEINISIDLNGDYHYNYSILDKECKYIKRFIGYYSSHESCVEAALLYVLKNLI